MKAEPEGAPFWKYNVKDEVITVPIKTYKISQNPESGHVGMITSKQEREMQPKNDFKCGRIGKRLEKLKE